MKHTSFKTRFLALVLTVVMLIGMMPSGIVGAEDPALAMGTASAITEGATVTDAAGADPVITFTDLTLKWEAKNPAVGRFQDGWWFGIKVTAPEGMTKQSDFVDGEKFVAYKSAVRDNTTATVKNFWNAQDSNAAAEDTTRYLTMWGLLNEEYLVEGSLRGGLSYAWSFDWDMDGIFEQQVTVKLDPAKLTLIKNDQTVFPAGTLGKASSLTAGGAVSGSMTNLATVTFDQVQLEWSPADPMLGRNSDGWWAGIRIDAPAGMTTQEDLTNAVYQTGVGTGWSANKSFWNAQDSDKNNPDTTRFLTMWGLLDEQIIKNAGADGIVRYSWRFDWDGDGVFEQRLHLELKIGGITLLKNGAQTYPLGHASALTAGGQVSGDQSPEATVTFNQVELQWSPADEDQGRAEGWWTGIRMDAPAGMTTEEALKNAVYQKLDGEIWSDSKSFWDGQASDKNNPDTTRYLTMWGPVDKVGMESAGADGKMTYAWRFDWDGNGTFDQLLTMELITDGIVLKQGDVQVYPLQTNVTTSVGTVGTAVNGRIPVTVDGQHIDWADETDGREAGWWVNLQVSAPAGLTEAELQAATFRIGEGEDQKYIEKSITTDGGKTVIDVWVPVYPESETAITENVHLDWDGEGTNRLNEQTVALTVNVANMTFGQAPISFDNVPETIQFGDTVVLQIVGGSGDGGDTYALKDENSNVVALVPESGKITGTELGEVTIVATKAADGQYTETKTELTLTVVQRKLTVDLTPVERVYGVVEAFSYTSAGTLAHENAELLVTFTTENEATTLPGIYTIRADVKVMVGETDVTGYYDVTVNTGDLIVNKAPRIDGNQPVFEIPEPADFLFGSASFANAVKADYPQLGEQTITYSIETTEIAASIDAETGVVTILPDVLPTENSSITVTATIAEDDGYLQGTAVYTMKVRYADTPVITLPETADWYTENVAQEVPEGYRIGFAAAAEDGLALPAVWGDTLTYDQEGINDYTFFLKDAATGAVAAPVTVTGLKLDKTDPNVTVSYGETVGQTLLEKLFFIRNEDIQVVVNFEDTTSGIGAVTLELDGEKVELTAEEIGAGTYVYTVNKTVRDHLKITVTDNAGRTGTPAPVQDVPYADHILVFDKDPANITAEFSGYSGIIEGDQPDSGADDIYYSNGDDFHVVFTVSDENLDLVASRVLAVKINEGEEKSYALDENNQVKIKLENAGEYVISASFVDAAGNTQTITRHYDIDPEAAVIEAEFVGTHVIVSGENPAEDIHYTGDQAFKVVFTVVDPKLNMNKNRTLVVSINGENTSYQLDGSNQVEIPLNEEGAFTITASFTKDTDRTGEVTRKYVVDYTEPEIEVEFEGDHKEAARGGDTIYYTGDDTFKAVFTVADTNLDLTKNRTLIVTDGEAVHELELDENNQASLSLKREGAFDLTASFTDDAGNTGTESRKYVVDYTEPEIEVEFEGDHKEAARGGDTVYYTGDDTFKAVFTVADTNLDLTKNRTLIVTDGEAVHELELDENNQASLSLKREGAFDLTASFTDDAGNTGTESRKYVVDYTEPEIKVEFEGDHKEAARGGDTVYYTGDNTFKAVFTVTDTNLDLTKNRTLIVTDGEAVHELELDENNQASLSLKREGAFDLTASFTDDAGNTGTQSRKYVVDYTDAIIDNELRTDARHTVETVGDKTIYFTDGVTFPVEISIVETNFNLTEDTPVVKVDGETESVVWSFDENIGLATAILTLSEEKHQEGLHEITVTYTDGVTKEAAATYWVSLDYAEAEVKVESINENGEYIHVPLNGEEIFFTDDTTFVITVTDHNYGVNGKTPVITVDSTVVEANWIRLAEGGGAQATITLSKEGVNSLKIDYTDSVFAVSHAGNICMDFAEAEVKVESINENGEYIQVPLNGEEIFYTNDVTLVITVTDHNYGVNGQEPVLTTGDADHVIEWKPLDGDENGAQATVTLSKEMLHELKLTYTDSVHEVEHTAQVEYDKTPAVIEIALSEEDKTENSNEGRLYYTGDVTATITITEKNFDPALVDVTVTGAAAGEEAEPVAVEWKEVGEPDGDTHTLEMVFTAESNYTLTVDYVDQAGNDAEEKTELFTIDSKLPHTPTFSYSASVHDNLLEKLSLGFYQSQMTVTVNVTDDVSGVMSLTLVTEQGSFEPVGEITQNGNVFTAEFKLPKDALTKDNQFKGKVYLIATDWSGNTIGTSDLKATDQLVTDDTTLILDNISPVGTFTVDPAVQEVENIRYFDGQFQIHMSIVEANYLDYKTENGAVVTPVVTLKKDGEVVAHGMGGWSNVCTNTLTLTEDGEYEVSVSYTDGSNNPMIGANIGNATWTSGKLTLDTTLPQITVTNIKQNSANKDETYGFVITVTDINLDVASVKPELTAVLRGEDGLYTTQTIELGEAKVDEKSQTVQYTVENLDQDALYTLTCYAKDLANNETKEMLLADGEAYETVNFSINREGSTYGFGNDTTEALVNQYYVHSVYEDVVIVEVNVDPIENYTVTVNGTELVEGTDYTTEQTGGGDQWSKRTYIISKEYFAAEGQYNIVVSSTDKANTTSYSDIKDLAVAFVVDQTAPVLTISGLQTGGRYQTSEQIVTLVPTDEGGRLNSLKILLLDSNGEPMVNKETGEDISVRFALSGEELIEYLEQNGGSVSFTIPVGLEMQVQIICNDCALNNQGLTNEYNEVFQRVTVSENIFVIFYANKPAFYGTIAGVAALVVLVVVLAKRKKSAA